MQQLLAAALLACSAAEPEASETAVTSLPPFEDAAISELYGEWAAWADARGWLASDLRRRGPRLQRTWTLGEPGKTDPLAPGTGRLALSVFASSKAEQSYGLMWRAATTDAEGHGLLLLVAAGGREITPDQVRLDLQPAGGDPIELGAPLSWKVGERVVQTARPEGLAAVRAHLAAYRGETFVEAATADLDALADAVQPVIDDADYTVCDYGPSPGGGIPGPCLPRAPTAEEQEAHRAAFSSELRRRRAAIARSAPWQASLGAVVPAF